MNFLEKHRGAISLVLGVTLSLLVIIAWHISNQNMIKSLQDKVSVTSQLFTQQFYGALSDNINKLKNLKHRLEITNGSYFDYWNKDAALIISQDPSFKFIEWIDDDGVIQLAEPLEANKEAIGLDVTKLDYRRSDWNKARKDSLFNLTHWLKLVQGDFAFLVDAPVYINNRFQGTITAGIDPSQRFDDIMRGLDEYYVTVKDERGTIFYSIGDTLGTEEFQHLSVTHEIPIRDAQGSSWTVTIVPNHIFGQTNSLRGNLLPLGLALILCSLLAISFFFRQEALAAERSQKIVNQKLRSLIDSSPMAICILNTDGIVTDFWNEAAEQMFGWEREEVIGRKLPFINDKNIDEFNQNIQRCIEQQDLKNQEIQRLRKDGSIGTFLINVGMISDQGQMLTLIEDITEVKRYQKELKKSLEEKEFLLTEIHHRVKNNLAIIVGLIELQKERISDTQLMHQLNETQNRIYSISGVHELLYQADHLAEISLGEYINKLLNHLQETYQGTDRPVLISKHINSLSVNINQAVPLGLLLNELMTNSFKHAFTNVQTPKITISLKEIGDDIAITYSDNGVGLQASTFEEQNSLGLNLIRNLLDQLGANYEISGPEENGFKIAFTFSITEKGSHSNL